MKKSIFLSLLSKKLRDEISAADDKQLQDAINQNGAYKALAANLKEYFDARGDGTSNAQTRLAKTWDMIAQAKEPFQGKYNHHATYVSQIRLILKIAAVMLIVLTTGTLSYYAVQSGKGTGFATLSAADEKMFTTLEDGTRIWLNLNSSIRFSRDFGSEKREVFLNGEAFFDVVHNAKIPLMIHARNVDITVKGTAFNVNAYKQLAGTEVLLLRGSVEVRNRLNDKQSVILKPHQKLIARNDPTGLDIFKVINTSESSDLKEFKWTK